MLLNGTPGNPIAHRRGVRQGDPLSPMLFIIAMDVLDRIFRKAVNNEILQPCGNAVVHHRCSLYADDIILFAVLTRQEWRAVNRLLRIFSSASGLQVNIQKCSITPIYGTQEDMLAFQQEFQCQINSSLSATLVFHSQPTSYPRHASGQ